uniref:Uncharacterized protein n=1 Tax=Anopheles atroparvus TaxID=41427 RepID=A0A182JEY2_ANOAO
MVNGSNHFQIYHSTVKHERGVRCGVGQGAVGGCVRGSVGSCVRGSVGSSVRGSVGSSVRGSVGSGVRGSVGGYVGRRQGYGRSGRVCQRHQRLGGRRGDGQESNKDLYKE